MSCMDADICRELHYDKFLEPKESNEFEWDKKTLCYVTDNFQRVRKMVRMASSGLNAYQVDDIMSDIVLYLKGASDYSTESKVDGKVMCSTIENYIAVGIKYCVQRYRAKLKYEEENVDYCTSYGEGEKSSLIDNIPDEKASEALNNVGYDIEAALAMLRGTRYNFGIDIYTLVYVRLLTIGDDKSDRYNKVINALGFSKKELALTEKSIGCDDGMTQLIKSICLTCEVDDVKKRVQKYVYGRKIIDNTLCSLA